MSNGDSACCPSGSWPSLQSDYIPKGTTEELASGLRVYHNGSASSGRAILLIHDVWGWESGRTKAIVDHFACEGYFAIVADLYRGNNLPSLDVIGSWAPTFPYEDVLKKELSDDVFPFIESKGCTQIGLMGFCWGSWCIFKVANDASLASKVACAVHCHPSVILEEKIWEKEPIDLARGSKCGPHMLLSASNDPEFVQEGGEYQKILQESYPGSQVHSFSNMMHGWVNRGDLEDETVKSDVEKAISLSLSFFASHVKPLRLLELEDRVAELESDNRTKTEQIDSLAAQLLRRTQEVEELKTTISSKDAEIAKLSSNVSTKADIIDDLVDDAVDRDASTVEEMEDTICALERNVEAKVDLLDEFITDINSKERILEQLQVERDRMRAEHAALLDQMMDRLTQKDAQRSSIALAAAAAGLLTGGIIGYLAYARAS